MTQLQAIRQRFGQHVSRKTYKSFTPQERGRLAFNTVASANTELVQEFTQLARINHQCHEAMLHGWSKRSLQMSADAQVDLYRAIVAVNHGKGE